MIYETLEIIRDQVNQYLETRLSESGLVVLDNIAQVENTEIVTMNDKVVLSLINMEEEIALKNLPNVQYKNGSFQTKNKPVNLNLYILFSANRTGYAKSITALSTIIEYFQNKKIFNQLNTVIDPTITTLDHVTEFKFVVDLYTPTFEQLNYVWGTLGGKSLPNAMYRVSIVKVEGTEIVKRGDAITEIEGTLEKSQL